MLLSLSIMLCCSAHKFHLLCYAHVKDLCLVVAIKLN